MRTSAVVGNTNSAFSGFNPARYSDSARAGLQPRLGLAEADLVRGGPSFHRHGESRGRSGRIRRESAPPEFADRERRRFVQRTGLYRVPDDPRYEQRYICYLTYPADNPCSI